MTTLNPNGYAVVWYGDGDTPKVCNGMANGREIDGKTYAIYDSVIDAITEFDRWPLESDSYGIIPARLVCDMTTVLVETKVTTLKESAKQ
jgi:hypothetical protein